MNRKEFFKTCAGAFCSCAAAEAFVPVKALAAAETKPQEDWQQAFVKERYAKLIGILSDKCSPEELSEILRQLGSYCASRLPLLQEYRGKIDEFIPEFKRRAGEEVSYDREKGVITVIGKERPECYCPLVDTKTTSPKVCDCSLGWQQYAYETLLGKKVKVTLKESVLRGGKRCVFEVHVV